MSETRRFRLAAVALFLATLALWSRALGNDFVNIDDGDYVLQNPVVRSGITGEGLVRAFSGTHSANWHPLTWVSHMLDIELFGLEPAGHHATSICLHALAAVALFGALLRLTGRFGPALVVAIIFAVHPLRVESVAWVSERKDVLAGLFGFLTLGAWARYADRPSRRNMVPVVGWLAAGLLSKPMLVTWPFLLLVLDFWPLGRWGRVPMRRLVQEKAPLFALVAISVIVTYLAQSGYGTARGFGELTLGQRGANAAIATVTYVVKTIWPSNLAVFYPHPAILDPGASRLLGATAALALLAAVSALALRERRRLPWLFTSWFWFLGTLVPVIGLVQVGSQSWANRYAYLPTVGLTIGFVWGLDELLRRLAARPFVAPALAAAVVAALGPVTWRELGYWRDSATLHRRALAVTTDNWFAHYGLGLQLATAGDLPGASEQFERALAIDPTHFPSWLSLGDALERLDPPRREQAIAAYRRAAQLRSDYVDAHYRLGVALARSERFEEAVGAYENALRHDPDHVGALRNLALAVARTGRPQDAVELLGRAVELAPDDGESRYLYGFVLLGLQRPLEAREQLEQAVRLRPRDPDAISKLGVALAATGRYREAERRFEEVLVLAPEHAEATAQLQNLRTGPLRGE